MKFQLELKNFNRLAKRYGLKRIDSNGALTLSEPLNQIAWAINMAARYFPWKGSCLLEALALQRMCVKRGLKAEILLGVAKNPAKPNALKAHAWTRAGDHILTGKKGHKAFTVVATFTW